jgi:hypothetical protein
LSLLRLLVVPCATLKYYLIILFCCFKFQPIVLSHCLVALLGHAASSLFCCNLIMLPPHLLLALLPRIVFVRRLVASLPHRVALSCYFVPLPHYFVVLPFNINALLLCLLTQLCYFVTLPFYLATLPCYFTSLPYCF